MRDMRTLKRCEIWAGILLLTVLMEGAALFCRFALGWTSTEVTAGTVGVLSFGIRIHHGYVGVLLLLPAWWGHRRGHAWGGWLLVFAAALVLSDLAHHFIFLWPLTGSPQWDWVYPQG
jgi:hypothetical protein